MVMWRHSVTEHNDHGERGTFFATNLNEDPASTTLAVAPPPSGPYVAVVDSCRAKLQSTLTAFRASHAGGVFSAKRTIDPLLDLWSLAAAVDSTVARPIETVLVALVQRSVITSAELCTCIERVETALARLPP